MNGWWSLCRWTTTSYWMPWELGTIVTLNLNEAIPWPFSLRLVVLCHTNRAINSSHSSYSSMFHKTNWQVLYEMLQVIILPCMRRIAETGFEPVTFWLWARRDWPLLHSAIYSDGWGRTNDLVINSHALFHWATPELILIYLSAVVADYMFILSKFWFLFQVS